MLCALPPQDAWNSKDPAKVKLAYTEGGLYTLQ